MVHCTERSHLSKSPVFVAFLEDSESNAYPIFEGNNTVPIGCYKVKGFFPYARNDDGRIRDFATLVLINSNTQVVNILFDYVIGDLSCFAYEGYSWESYSKKHADKITRHIGWAADTALRMLND